MTQDLDICMAMSEENISKLRTILTDYHPWHRMNSKSKLSFLEHPKSVDNLNNIYLQTDLGVLDILSETQPAGVFQAIKHKSIEIPLYGHKCKVISIDDLINWETTA